MPEQSEFKILRARLAEEIQSGRAKDDVICELGKFASGMVSLAVQMQVEMSEMRQRLAYYENPHSPPSKESIKWKQEKREKAAKAKAGGKPRNRGGARAGHRGASHRNKSAETVHHRPEKCGKCGGKEFGADVRVSNKLITDIPELPKAVTRAHVVHRVTCSGCGSETEAPAPGIAGTSIGPVAASVALDMWSHANSIESVRDMLRMHGIRATKSTVGRLIEAASRKLKREVETIKAAVAASASLKMDETCNKIVSELQDEPDKTGWTWICIGDDAVLLIVAASRSAEILHLYFPFFDKPLTADGYAGYALFKTLQRCWAHVLRESLYAAQQRGPPGEALHDRLAGLLHEAKRAPPDGDLARRMEREALAIASGYRSLGEDKFATKLENAAPNLFTFVTHPELEPTNNESERLIRPVVIQRLIRQHHVTEEGMAAFSRIMTCVLTWRKRGLNAYDEFYRCLSST